MPNYCIVKGCKSRHVKGSPITFHRFPKDPTKRSEWVKNIRREDFVPSYSSTICSKHFEEECFDREKFGGTWLKSTALPTLFNFSTNSSKEVSTLKTDSKALIRDTSFVNEKTRATSVDETFTDDGISIDEVSNSKTKKSQDKCKKRGGEESAPKSKKKRISYLGDFKEGVTYTNDELLFGLRIANDLVKKQNRKLRCLKGINNRLRKRVDHLNDVLEEYKKKVYIPSEVLKEALARNKKKFIKPSANGTSADANEDCDDSVPRSP